LKECSSCKDLTIENRELKEIIEKSSQLITADKVVSTSESTSTYDYDMDASNDILPFEFSMIFRELRYHLAPLYSKIGDREKVLFCGKINKNTGIVVSSNLGRIDTQQDGSSL
jgi:hypothetical protein